MKRKPNKDILEHDRKRQIQLKLLVLEEKLAGLGYSDAEIADKLEEARQTLDAASEDSVGSTAIIALQKSPYLIFTLRPSIPDAAKLLFRMKLARSSFRISCSPEKQGNCGLICSSGG